jgi:tetratricopeptide (TPR) repeat protein
MSLRQLLAGGVFLWLLLGSCSVCAAGDDAAKKKDRAQSHLIEARRLAADYRIDKAAGKARDALKDNPSLAEAHVYLGQERLRASDLKNAKAEVEQALALDPYLASAHCWLGYVLYQEGQLESATDHWTLAMRLDPTSPHAFAGVALSQLKHGQEEEAVRTYEKALTYDRRFADSNFLESDKGPKWSGQLLQDLEMLLAKLPKASYP